MGSWDQGILSGLDDPQGSRARASYPEIEARPGRIVEHRASGLVGFVVRASGGVVTLKDSRGRECPVRLLPGGFVVDGRIVSLTTPRPDPANGSPARTASGSTAVPSAPARVARANRIFVEGLHDAELVEKVWGDDLRVEGVVVEPIHGIDNLADKLLAFRPAPDRRLGVLVDHLVEGTKEWRAAKAVQTPCVLVTGTPFVDVWQAVQPSLVGLDAWPDIPPGTPWKEGVCRALGATQPAVVWRHLVDSVRSYEDLQPELVGAVERLIDFVTTERWSEPDG